jgi:hypothetical protein
MAINTGQIILMGLGILLLLFIIVLWKSPRIRFILRSKIKYPGRKSGYVKTILKDELKSAKEGQKYETLDAFMKDCPNYCVSSDMLGTMIRNILRSAGINFQQYVFIRKNATKDKTVYIRRDEEDKILLHAKGTYALPADYSKDVIYYDIEDMRPLIDITNEEDWKNPDMCADVVTAITNSKSMAGLNPNQDKGIWNIITLCLVFLALIGIVALYYHGTQQDKQLSAIWDLVNSTRKP